MVVLLVLNRFRNPITTPSYIGRNKVVGIVLDFEEIIDPLKPFVTKAIRESLSLDEFGIGIFIVTASQQIVQKLYPYLCP